MLNMEHTSISLVILLRDAKLLGNTLTLIKGNMEDRMMLKDILGTLEILYQTWEVMLNNALLILGLPYTERIL
jgi:hypothetical protein